MAVDAIARQSDVDKNSVVLFCDPKRAAYSPGTITFFAKKGRSIDLGQIHESIAATRLSGITNMRVNYLEITVRGKMVARGKDLFLAISGTDQELLLGGDTFTLERQMQELSKRPEEVVTLVGRVDGWSGRFPIVLKALADRYGTDGKKPLLLVVTAIEGAKK